MDNEKMTALANEYYEWVIKNIDLDVFIDHFEDFKTMDMQNLMMAIGVTEFSFETMNPIANAKCICDVGLGDDLMDAIVYADITDDQRERIFKYDNNNNICREMIYYQKLMQKGFECLNKFYRQKMKGKLEDYLMKELNITVEKAKDLIQSLSMKCED